MSTATTQLEKPGVRQAYVFLIEGHDVAFTDSDDFAAIQTAWTASGYTFRPGLELSGTISRQIDLLGFKIEPVSITVDLVDPIPWSSASSLARLFASKDESAATTVLTSNADRSQTASVDVRDTTNTAFPASGTVHVGHERIDYSGKTATTLTGLTRGKFPVVPGKSAWGHTHRIPTDGEGPEVATAIRVWKNRMVSVYIVTIDPDTGTWTTQANSLAEFVGYIESGPDWDGERWSLSCISIERRMQGQLMRQQFAGTVRKGFNLLYDCPLTFKSSNGNATWNDSVSITVTAGHYTIDELIATINSQLTAATLTYEASLSLVGSTCRLSLNYTTAASNWVYFSLERTDNLGLRVMDLLGWPSGIAAFGNGVTAAQVIKVDAPQPAVSTEWSPYQGFLAIENSTGVWQNQATDDMATSFGTAHGYLQIDGLNVVWLCSFDAIANEATWLANYRLDGKIVHLPPGIPPGFTPVARRFVGEDEPIGVRQVWMTRGSLARVLLRMLLSTGTTDYNDATYDKWPLGMSLGIPSTIVDIDAIEALSEQIGDSAQLFQVIQEPESAADHIESLMQTFGFHLVWARTSTSGQYKLTPIIPTVISGLPSQFTLDTSNTGSDPRVRASSGAEYVKNKATLLYNRDTSSGEFLASVTAENMASQSEHDEPDAFEHKALSLYDYDGKKIASWVANVAAPTMAYFGRPVRTFTRSCSRALWNIFCGAVVTLTDPEAPSDTDGVYGVTAVKGWVIAVSKNLETHEVEVTVMVPKGRAFRLAPTAMLDYTRGDKGYDAANRRLYCMANEFTPAATGTTDIDYFFVDDGVVIVEVDPASAAAPTTWQRTVSAVVSASGYIEISSTLSLPAFDSTKRYYVILDSYANIDPSPTRSFDGTNPVAFQADSLGIVYGDAGLDPQPGVLWSSFLPSLPDATAPTGDEHYRRPWDKMVQDSRPLSSHMLRDWAYAVNNAYRHVTNQRPICEFLTAYALTTSATYGLIAGPFKVRVPPGAETLDFVVFLQNAAAGTGYAKMCTSPACPTFESDTTAYHTPDTPPDSISTEVSTSSTSVTAVSGSVAVKPNTEGFTYVWVEFKGGGHGVRFYGVSAAWQERAIS